MWQSRAVLPHELLGNGAELGVVRAVRAPARDGRLVGIPYAPVGSSIVPSASCGTSGVVLGGLNPKSAAIPASERTTTPAHQHRRLTSRTKPDGRSGRRRSRCHQLREVRYALAVALLPGTPVFGMLAPTLSPSRHRAALVTRTPGAPMPSSVRFRRSRAPRHVPSTICRRACPLVVAVVTLLGAPTVAPAQLAGAPHATVTRLPRVAGSGEPMIGLAMNERGEVAGWTWNGSAYEGVLTVPGARHAGADDPAAGRHPLGVSRRGERQRAGGWHLRRAGPQSAGGAVLRWAGDPHCGLGSRERYGRPDRRERRGARGRLVLRGPGPRVAGGVGVRAERRPTHPA
jgi:hypothetical protein